MIKDSLEREDSIQEAVILAHTEAMRVGKVQAGGDAALSLYGMVKDGHFGEYEAKVQRWKEGSRRLGKVTSFSVIIPRNLQIPEEGQEVPSALVATRDNESGLWIGTRLWSVEVDADGNPIRHRAELSSNNTIYHSGEGRPYSDFLLSTEMPVDTLEEHVSRQVASANRIVGVLQSAA